LVRGKRGAKKKEIKNERRKGAKKGKKEERTTGRRDHVTVRAGGHRM